MVSNISIRLLRQGLWFGVAACLLFGVASADSPKTSPAKPLVKQALEREVHGDATGRREALLQAIFQDTDYAPARWPSGQLKYQESWLDYQNVAKTESARPEVQEYLKVRDSYIKSAKDQLQLANWCRERKLFAQEYVHLITALELSGNPSNVQIRARLGHQFINGVWMTPTEISEARELSERIQSAMKTWTPKLQLLARQLCSPRTDLQNQARKELLAIDDPDALPVLEAIFSQDSLQSADLLVELLSQMNFVEANRYLARQAVLSPYVTVREAAAGRLKSRPVETYAPLLLESLHTPIQSRVRLFVSQRGIQLTHLLASETKAIRDIARHDSRVVFHNVPTSAVLFRMNPARRKNGNPYEAGSIGDGLQLKGALRSVEAEVLQKQLQAYAQQRAVDEKNDQLQEWNDRIFAALKNATGLELPNDPEDWWKWWNEYNHLTAQGKKPVRYTKLEDARPRVTHIPMIVPTPSCLTAGTPIWTDRGFVAIEKVQIGDRVLSKHPQTGELAYQPVLRTTVRPATRVMTARFGSSEVTSTEGHTFWVSGKGWQKMRDIPAGSSFHTVDGFVGLETREKAEPQPTYNLVVAGFHTYFVGPDMLFSHDVTFAEPVNNTVPGLVADVQKPNQP